MNLKHRNSQKRIISKDACYFVTVKTQNNFPFFKESIFCDLFLENLRLSKKLKHFQIYGWVLIFDHFHLMIQPNDEFNISDVMFSIKKQFSHDINRIIGFNKLYVDVNADKRSTQPEVDKRSTQPEADKRLSAFRKNDEFIADHQNYVNLLKSKFHQKYKNPYPHPKPCLLIGKFHWKESFHDHYIRNENDFVNHMKYIAYNPEKHHMPNHWSYVYTNKKYEYLTDESL